MMKGKHPIRAPVITLADTVLFPWTIIHIELSDKEHIKIIKDALREGSNIVISLRKNPFTQLGNIQKEKPINFYEVGTIGRPIVIDEHDDEVMKVVFKGQERVLIKDIVQNLPFPIYELELCPDVKNKFKKTPSVPKGDACIEKLANLLHNWGERNIMDSLDRENFFSSMENINHLINNISSHLILDSEIKQILLEALDIKERIQILSMLFPHEMVDQEDIFASKALKEYEAIEMKMIKSQ